MGIVEEKCNANGLAFIPDVRVLNGIELGKGGRKTSAIFVSRSSLYCCAGASISLALWMVQQERN
jgi:hypothetical protein